MKGKMNGKDRKIIFTELQVKADAGRIRFGDLKSASNLIHLQLMTSGIGEQMLGEVGDMMFVLDQVASHYQPKPSEREDFQRLLTPTSFYGFNAYYGDGISPHYFNEGLLTRSLRSLTSALSVVRDSWERHLPAIKEESPYWFLERVKGSEAPVVFRPSFTTTGFVSRGPSTSLGWPPVETKFVHTGYSFFTVWESQTARGRAVYYDQKPEGFKPEIRSTRKWEVEEVQAKAFEAAVQEAGLREKENPGKGFMVIGSDGVKSCKYYLEKVQAVEACCPRDRARALLRMSSLKFGDK